MLRNTLGLIRTGGIKWTRQAKDCYFLGCNCEECSIKKAKIRCNLKAVVLELVRRHGVPNDERNKRSKILWE